MELQTWEELANSIVTVEIWVFAAKLFPDPHMVLKTVTNKLQIDINASAEAQTAGMGNMEQGATHTSIAYGVYWAVWTFTCQDTFGLG